MTSKTGGKNLSIKFAEGIFFNEIGISGLKLTEYEPRSTRIKPVGTMEGQVFFRSEKSRGRVLEELRSMLCTFPGGLIMDLPIIDVACEIRGAAKRLGIESIEHQRLAKAIARIADMIDAAILNMGKQERKACNAAYKQTRAEALTTGTKMLPYQAWMVHKVGAMIQSGARDKANFSRFLPAEPGTCA